MQDAMSLTRVIQLDATRQRRARLYESDRNRVEDCLGAADGDVKAALEAFGLQLDAALLDRFVRQAFDCRAEEWLARLATLTARTKPTAAAGGGEGEDEHEEKNGVGGGKEGDEGKSNGGEFDASAAAQILEEKRIFNYFMSLYRQLELLGLPQVRRKTL